ncbi:MAG: pyrroline-5-carboxylate reductase [Oscillospiraceae bacterium]|nr:pyrroline-5-carboxylate reductase [Oscillospiraceae bacterium]
MQHKIAFIGTGVMAAAILKGACRTTDPGNFILTDALPEKAETLAAELGCRTAASNREAAEEADIIFLCVKPQTAAPVLAEIAPVLQSTQKLLCSILAGVTIDTIRIRLGAQAHPVIRIMPNTPALIGKGLMLLACDNHVSDTAKAETLALLTPCGETMWLAEHFFDQGTALSGSSPAFVYLFIDALADAGTAAGLPRDQAVKLAACAAYGAAAMVLETDETPQALANMVCSPGGSTLAGVAALEACGFHDTLGKAVEATCARSRELGAL